MATFDFPYHNTPETIWPESSTRVQFGNSYVFTAPPSAPDQRIFRLFFPALKYYTDSGGAVDATIEPQLNLQALINFYEEHHLWKPFTYPHPVFGNVEVRFNKPLQVPQGKAGGGGVVEGISLEFIEDIS